MAPEDFQEYINGSVNKSASGKVEVIYFGTSRFLEFNIKYATSRAIGSGGAVRLNLQGLEDLRALMQFLTRRGPLKIIPDEDDSATFYTIQLESTPDDSKGLKFKLKELYGQGLPGFFETGVLRFLVIEEDE